MSAKYIDMECHFISKLSMNDEIVTQMSSHDQSKLAFSYKVVQIQFLHTFVPNKNRLSVTQFSKFIKEEKEINPLINKTQATKASITYELGLIEFFQEHIYIYLNLCRNVKYI